jgi:hypothetical protein
LESLAKTSDCDFTPFGRQVTAHSVVCAPWCARLLNRRLQDKQEHTLSTSKLLRSAVAAAVIFTGLGIAIANARPALLQGASISQPDNPFVCRTDEGYGRSTSCDNRVN